MQAKEKTVAKFTVFNAADMTPEMRKEIAHWMRREASFLIRYGRQFTHGWFTGRYIPKSQNTRKETVSHATAKVKR